jgi:ABC-type multidrug transport system fused ATPase/permease subunit
VKSLLRLVPYLRRYKRPLLWGLCTVVLSNLFTVATPLFVGRAIDVLKNGLEAGRLEGADLALYAGLVVGFALWQESSHSSHARPSL